MKAVKITKVGESSVVEVDRPDPGPREVLIEITSTGICGSDVSAYVGKHPFRIPPVISGHEAAGVVVRTGPEVDGLVAGDRVVVEPHVGCGECGECRRGQYNLCRHKKVLGTQAWTGSFAEYIVSPTECVYKVPVSFTNDQSVIIEPLSVAVHAARVAKVEPGQSIFVLGCGPIGLLHTFVASQRSPKLLACSDLKDFNLEMARLMGATDVLNPGRVEVRSSARDLTNGQGADVVFVVFHDAEVLQTALDICRPGGTVVLVATSSERLDLFLGRIQLSELQLRGTVMYTRPDYLESIRLAGSGGDKLSRLITHRIGLTELPAYLDLLGRGVLPDAVKVVVEAERA